MSLFIILGFLACPVVTSWNPIGKRSVTRPLTTPTPNLGTSSTTTTAMMDTLAPPVDLETEEGPDFGYHLPRRPDDQSRSRNQLKPGSEWFEKLFGFRERGPSGFDNAYGTVHKNMQLVRQWDGSFEFVSRISGRRFQIGEFDTSPLKDLRHSVQHVIPGIGHGLGARIERLKIKNIVADIRDLHRDPSNQGAVLQVASHSNFLDPPSYTYTPEDGITDYIQSYAQGSACAIECAPGTLFRNYFVRVQGNKTAGLIDDNTIKMERLGQSADHSLNALTGLARALHNRRHNYWKVKGGYIIPTSRNALSTLSRRLQKMSQSELGALADTIIVGIQKDTEVTTVTDRKQTVTQVYCPALPIAYVPGLDQSDWEQFARLVLDSIYESTMLVAEWQAQRIGRSKVYLTIVDGGVSGDIENWIGDAIEKAVMKLAKRRFNYWPLDIYIVHRRNIPASFEELGERINARLQS